MKKQFKKLWLFPMLAALFMLTNCQEDYTEDSGHGHNVNSQVVRKPFKDFKNLPRLLDKALKAKLTKARDTTDIYNFQIDSTEVMEITTDQGKFYTMSITRDFDYPVDMFENLVISDYGTKIEAFIVSYQPDADYYNRVATHKYAPFTGGISTTIINYENIEKGVITTCITYSVIACAKDADPHPIDGSCVLYVNTITDCTTYIFQSPVIGTSVLPSKLVNLKLSSGGGGGSSPGGGGSGGTIPGNTTNQGGGNAGPLTPSLSGPVTGPMLPSNQEIHEKNCAELAVMMQNQKILDSYNDIRSDDKLSDSREWGYLFRDSADTTSLEPSPNSESMYVPTGGDRYGASHTHPDPTNEIQQNAPMFSLSDLMKMAELFNNYQPSLDQPDQTKAKCVFTLTVKTGPNTNETYALKVENWMKLKQYFMMYAGLTLEEKRRKGRRLERLYIDRQKSGGGMENYLTDLFTFMDNQGIKGLTIYKANADLTEWTKKQYNPVTKEVTDKPCN